MDLQVFWLPINNRVKILAPASAGHLTTGSWLYIHEPLLHSKKQKQKKGLWGIPFTLFISGTYD